MGSGRNREWWQAMGTRTTRRKGTKTAIKSEGNERMRIRMKAARAEAKRRTRPKADA